MLHSYPWYIGKYNLHSFTALICQSTLLSSISLFICAVSKIPTNHIPIQNMYDQIGLLYKIHNVHMKYLVHIATSGLPVIIKLNNFNWQDSPFSKQWIKEIPTCLFDFQFNYQYLHFNVHSSLTVYVQHNFELNNMTMRISIRNFNAWNYRLTCAVD